MKPVKNVSSASSMEEALGVPSAGQLIGDRYRLDRPLERGAMGSVWRAEQVRLRAPVAVKFLDPSLIGDREMHDRFIQEARSAAAVRSAHVVQVFDYGSEDGVPYIAMELLNGENLDARLGSRGTLTPAELAKLFSELARGISQAHAIGVIHRDLKPGNIFIAREGEHEVTKIVDFGIAKVKASALRLTQGIGTQLGTLLGTPQYMSPEQVRGSGSIDHRTDLWALAVIACECLTGRCPFSGTTIGDLTVQICTEKPPSPSSMGPVPAGFDQWFAKATQKKPNKRFQSVEEMAERLQAVLGRAVLAAPGGARAGRRITFPSRSEVRLVYSAVVTWKGHVVNRLATSWTELCQLLRRVVNHLAIQYEIVQQRLDELLDNGRLAFLRPVIERHGMFASVALLCCGIIMLGYSSRGEPVEPRTPPAIAATLGAAPAELAAIAPAAAAQPAAATSSPAALPPASPMDALREASLPPSAAAELSVASQNDLGGVALPARALDRLSLPKPAVEKGLATEPVTSSATLALQPRVHVATPAKGPPTRARVAPASAPRASADTAAATPDPSRAITKAMAQAAAKILTADDLVASLPPPKKQPNPHPAPRATRASKASSTPSKASALHPFDDRL